MAPPAQCLRRGVGRPCSARSRSSWGGVKAVEGLESLDHLRSKVAWAEDLDVWGEAEQFSEGLAGFFDGDRHSQPAMLVGFGAAARGIDDAGFCGL